MEIGIVKEYYRGYNVVEERFSVKTTYFKYLNLFKIDDEKINASLNGYSDDGGVGIVIFILYHIFIVIPSIILIFVFSFYIGFLLLLVAEAIILKIYRCT